MITKDLVVNISKKYTLRIVNSVEEIEKFAEFNELIHEDNLKAYILRLYDDYPYKDDIYWIYITDNETNEIISSLALLPLVWNFAGIAFKIAEMGFVGTLKEYRAQGLFGILNSYYENILEEQEYTFSVLRGIPNFYRAYGYEFALPLNAGYMIPVSNIPASTDDNIKIRKSVQSDLNYIKKSYNEIFDQLYVATKFDKKSFSFRMMNETCNLNNSITYIIEENKKSHGFFTIGSIINEDQADLIMGSQLTNNQMIKVLNFIKNYNRGSVEEFRINVIEDSDFSDFIKSLGGYVIKPWEWQIKLLSFEKFLINIKKEFENRIEKSMFKGLTKDITISNYRQIIKLEFLDGELKEIKSVTEYPNSSCDLRIPKTFMIKLLLSHKTVAEINNVITDALVKKESELLISNLFPKLLSLPHSWY